MLLYIMCTKVPEHLVHSALNFVEQVPHGEETIEDVTGQDFAYKLWDTAEFFGDEFVYVGF